MPNPRPFACLSSDLSQTPQIEVSTPYPTIGQSVTLSHMKPTYPPAPKGWDKHPSASRPFRWFYYNAKRRVSVVRSWVTNNWLVSIDGHGIQSGEFATAQEAIASVERNDA